MNILNRYGQLDPRLFHRQTPSPLPHPQPGHFNEALAAFLNLPTTLHQHWVALCAGSELPDGFDPLAMAYAGHQFGQWAGQLGDGRGLLLTQLIANDGEVWDLHLKGAGVTPYSRGGDGRAVLRSVIREYLAGHALNALGVASSHALGFVYSTQLPVQRETLEPAATLLRVADSHIRLGHFEWINRFAPDLLQPFTDAVIQWHYPDLTDGPTRYLEFAREVIRRTAYTIAQWQLVGFAHGVMNTDNLSITGSTLDFGPYGFMERFQPDWINNHSDHQGRYSYQNQPGIAHWNLWVWLGQLLRLGVDKEALQQALAEFEPLFLGYYQEGMARKMGLAPTQEHFQLGMEFLAILQQEQLDYTNSFRLLAGDWASLMDDCSDRERFKQFSERYRQALNDSENEHHAQIHTANPVYVLRNAMAQHAIERAYQGDLTEVARLFELLSNPYEAQPDNERPADRLPPAQGDSGVAVSCSS